MRVVAGLGNPGNKYEASRHNIGFRVIDRLATRMGIGGWKAQFDALVARGEVGGQAVYLVKPQTFMNNSGDAIAALLRFYKVPLEDCVAVVDDMDLALGKVRQRRGGSDGGHLGLRSIIERAGGQEFKRLRIGVGRPAPGQSVVGHVLSANPEEEAVLDGAVDQAVEWIRQYLETGKFENHSAS